MTHGTSNVDATEGFDPRSVPARLPFAWWNTKLAALKSTSNPEKKQAHLDAVIDVVRALIRQQGCLLLGLAEVREQNVFEWVPPEMRADWDVIVEPSTDSRPFDVVILFDRTRLSLMETRWVRKHHAGYRVRAGLVATFAFADNSDWLILAAAHWTSDMGGTKDASDRRMNAAGALQAAIAASLSDVGSSTPVLILGDFNAEPFDSPFGGGLATARSRAEVQRHRPRNPSDLLFYNAAWRWLSEQYRWGGEPSPPTLAGTYRQEGKNVPTVWRTFDQVLVSQSLLGSASWSLDERVLDIFQDRCVFDEAKSRPCAPFDHLPIVGHLQRSALPSDRVRQS